jgi:hypothetical protein
VDISYLLPSKKAQKEIKQAFEKCDTTKLKPVYEHLNEKYDYDTLRLIQAYTR